MRTLGSVADDYKGHREARSERPDGVEQRVELLDWIQSRDRGNDKRVVGNRERTPRARSGAVVRDWADLDAVVYHLNLFFRKAFGNHVGLQALGNSKDLARSPGKKCVGN